MTAAARHACFRVKDFDDTDARQNFRRCGPMSRLIRTGKAVGHIVGTNHETVKTGKHGANGEEVVPLVQGGHR